MSRPTNWERLLKRREALRDELSKINKVIRDVERAARKIESSERAPPTDNAPAHDGRAPRV